MQEQGREDRTKLPSFPFQKIQTNDKIEGERDVYSHLKRWTTPNPGGACSTEVRHLTLDSSLFAELIMMG